MCMCPSYLHLLLALCNWSPFLALSLALQKLQEIKIMDAHRTK